MVSPRASVARHTNRSIRHLYTCHARAGCFPNTALGVTVDLEAFRTRHLVMHACGLLLAACVVPMGLSGCSVEGSESGGQTSQSGQSGGGEVQMSGDYEVGADGKLKIPANRLPSHPSDSALILDQHTDVSAQTFGHYFIQTVEYAFNTGDTGSVSALCLPESKGCKDLVGKINDIYSAGGWFDNAQYLVRQVLDTQPYTFSEADDVTAVVYWVTGTTNNSYDGEKLYENVGEGQMQWELHLKQTEHSWIVQGLSIDPIEETAG